MGRLTDDSLVTVTEAMGCCVLTDDSLVTVTEAMGYCVLTVDSRGQLSLAA